MCTRVEGGARKINDRVRFKDVLAGREEFLEQGKIQDVLVGEEKRAHFKVRVRIRLLRWTVCTVLVYLKYCADNWLRRVCPQIPPPLNLLLPLSRSPARPLTRLLPN